MYEELVKQLRELPHLLFVQLGGHENIVYQAAEGGINMIKTFCSHCGKEIKGIDINELAYDDCFYDYDIHKFIGYEYVLCKKCWDERNQAHINFDMKFLNIVEE